MPPLTAPIRRYRWPQKCMQAPVHAQVWTRETLQNPVRRVMQLKRRSTLLTFSANSTAIDTKSRRVLHSFPCPAL